MPFNTSPDKFGMDGEINIRFLTQMQQSYILIKYLKNVMMKIHLHIL